MKIVFICGCMEPGRDGVGDYIRCLSAELQSQNHIVSIIALNDPFVTVPTIENQKGGAYTIPVLRLPKRTNKKDRLIESQKWVTNNSPDWISLQFVPYSFQDEGLPFNFYKLIQLFRKKEKLHIMFHELWIDDVVNIKQRLIKFAQRMIIRTLVKRLNPQVIHTTIPYNQKRLFENSIQAHTLELFGNIKKSSVVHLPESISKMQHSETSVLYFGAPARGEFLNEVIKGLIALKTDAAVPIIIACGKAQHKEAFIEALAEKLPASKFTIMDCGFLEIDEISSLMSYATLGIGRAEGHLLGKSGTIIAMLEHGLPVWLPKLKNKTQLGDFAFRKDYIFADANNACNSNLPKKYEGRLTEISKQFINQLESIQ